MANKRRQACRPIRSFPADTAACETWLSDLAARGLHLDRMARYFAWFDRGEPMENVRFRLEPVTKEDDWVSSEEREDFREMGWTYLDTWENLYRIYRADDPAAPELHTDPKTQALTLDRLIRKSAMGYAAVAAVWIILCAFCLLTGEDYLTRLRLSFLYFDLTVIVLPVLFFFDRGGLLDLLALRRSLRRGEPQPHPTVRRFGIPAGLLGLFLVLFPTVFNVTRVLTELPNYRTITDPAGLPYVSLETIEEDPGFVRLTDSSPNWGQDYFHSYQRTRSLLVPEYCITRQYGEVKDRNWEYVAETTFPQDAYIPYRYDPQLSVTRVKLLTESLAMRVYDELEADLIAGEVIETALGVDEAIFLVAAPAGDAPRSRILLREGRTVLYAAYYGEADLGAHLDAFAARLV